MKDTLQIARFNFLVNEGEDAEGKYFMENNREIEVHFWFEAADQKHRFGGSTVVKAINGAETTLAEMKEQVLEFLRDVE